MKPTARVVKVTAQEFELSDGRVYKHHMELEAVPTVEEFQRIYEAVVARFFSGLELDQESR